MGISIWQIIIILLLFVYFVGVYGTILKKAGFSRWWSLLLLVPIINLISTWAFAFMKWPVDERK